MKASMLSKAIKKNIGTPQQAMGGIAEFTHLGLWAEKQILFLKNWKTRGFKSVFVKEHLSNNPFQKAWLCFQPWDIKTMCFYFVFAAEKGQILILKGF